MNLFKKRKVECCFNVHYIDSHKTPNDLNTEIIFTLNSKKTWDIFLFFLLLCNFFCPINQSWWNVSSHILICELIWSNNQCTGISNYISHK